MRDRATDSWNSTTSLDSYDDGFSRLSDAEVEGLIRLHIGGPVDRLKDWMSERLSTWRRAHTMMSVYGSPPSGQPAAPVSNLPWWRLVQTTIAIHLCMMMTDDPDHYRQILCLAVERGFTMRNTPWSLLVQIGEVLFSAQVADLMSRLACASGSAAIGEDAGFARVHVGLCRILRARADHTLSTREAAREMRLSQEGKDRW